MRVLKEHMPALAASAVLLLLGVVFFSFTGRDDAYITYWPAYTLSNFGDILNYNGERLEQSSSLLLVLILGLASKITSVDIPLLGLIFSVFFGMAAIFLTGTLASTINIKRPYPVMILCTSVYFVYWTFSGMESTLAAVSILLFLLSFSCVVRSRLRHNIFFILSASLFYMLVRPEGVFVLGFFALSMLVVTLFYGEKGSGRHDRTVDMLLLLMIIGLLFAIIALFRTSYFGALFPQPVAAKVSPGLLSFQNGISYIKESFSIPDMLIFSILLIHAFVFVIRDSIFKADNSEGAYIRFGLAVFVFIYMCFLLASGGDWMEGGRMIVPVVPVAVIIVSGLFDRSYRSGRKILSVSMLLLLLALQVFGVFYFARNGSTGLPLWAVNSEDEYFKDSGFTLFERSNLVHIRDIPLTTELDRLLDELKKSDAVEGRINIMSAQMGMVPYYISMKHYGDVRFMDRASLADDLFMKCPLTRDIRKRRTGMDLRYSFFFQEMKYLKAECDMPVPDIIFDISREHTKHIKKNGYSVVYMQAGSVKKRFGSFTRTKINDNQFIAVRTDLLPYLGSTWEELRVWDWRSMSFNKKKQSRTGREAGL